MDFVGRFEKRTSKLGKEYEVLILETQDGKFKKDVYLNSAEIQLLHLLNEKNNSNDEMPFLR